jgi:cystathionine beta-synthase
VVVVLPDTGARYLSKVFSDDWMRTNRYLEAEWVEGTVESVLASKRLQEVITVSSQEKTADVIQTMKKHDISQLPVLENGKLVGLITEVDLLDHMVQGPPRSKEETIASLVSADQMEVVGAKTSLEALTEIFSRGHVAVVLAGEKVSGIATKIDLIDYLATQVM